MKIRITEPPKHEGVLETLCRRCGREILIVRSAKNPDKTVTLDDDPGPYALEPDEHGVIHAVYRHILDGYDYHYEDGDCKPVAKPKEPQLSQFEILQRQVEGWHRDND